MYILVSIYLLLFHTWRRGFFQLYYRFRLHRNNKIQSTFNTQPSCFSTPPSTVYSQQSTIIPVPPELILLIATFYFDNSTLSSFTTRRLRGIDFSRGSKSNTFLKASSTCSNGTCPFALKTTFPDWSRMTV